MIELLKAAFYGLVEGITEWLPISSTGHLILLNELLPMNVTKEFWDMFLVVIQLGAIMAVVILFWNTIFPFSFKTIKDKSTIIKRDVFSMWFKALVSCIPAAIIGILFDEQLDALFYNGISVALALIIFGIGFIVIENKNKNASSNINTLAEITYKTALLIGLFQLVAAIFPGTSRSGATILGALLIGVSRKVAAEYTFILAIPVMFGASLLKLLKFGFSFTSMEVAILLVGCIVAFGVSIFVIRFLMGYIRKHDFKIFGWYRIALGICVLTYFTLFK
jgi:undecaprenyl-diphosphatase